MKNSLPHDHLAFLGANGRKRAAPQQLSAFFKPFLPSGCWPLRPMAHKDPPRERRPASAQQGPPMADRPIARSRIIGSARPASECGRTVRFEGARPEGSFGSPAYRYPTEPSCSDSAFVIACRDADNNRIRQLMTSRTFTVEKINFRDVSGKTGIGHICTKGNLPLLELITPIPSLDVNLSDNEGNAPIHFASQAGHVEVLQHLINNFKTIEVDQRNIFGITALMKAALQGKTKCVKILLAAGASPILRDQGRGLCPIEWARFCGRQACAEVLEKFMKINKCNPNTHCGYYNDLEKWNSEPNLPRFLHTDIKDSWFHQKFKKAFKSNDTTKKSDYSLVSNLKNATVCASSLGAPSCAVNTELFPNTSRTAHNLEEAMISEATLLPQVQVTEISSLS